MNTAYRVLRMALHALRRNVMRSVLTCLGIIIGIAAVIAMMEIGRGSSHSIEQTIASLEATVNVDVGTKKVTIFEMLPKAAGDVGRSTRWVLMGSVKRYGIDVITGAKVMSMKNGTVTFEREGKTESMQFDNIVNAVGSRSVRKIADAMEKSGIPFTVIGDSIKPAQIDKAIHDGFMAVMNLK